ncbi:ankyrin repeat domain-containing protein [Andreprevotia chitinilytica]|uniref:ankyrin repeat domain-containing protein n=1 Tax=Andreprevotia chitinilytica TaxID=396808 RepID=UPI00146FD328|nr:ankyrin repeat domain-containing protein [Andreprevotia chitinilytica]
MKLATVCSAILFYPLCLSAAWAQEPPSEAELQTEYRHFAITYPAQQRQYKISHILLANGRDSFKALEKLRSGRSFASVAQEMSRDEKTKSQGGDVGWLYPRQMTWELSTALPLIPKGQVSERAVKAPDGWHVIRVDDVADGVPPPYEKARPGLLRIFNDTLATIDAKHSQPDALGNTLAALVIGPAQAKRLLDAGANPNAMNSDGVSPLVIACMSGDFELIDMLLKAGANPTLRKEKGLNAWYECLRTRPDTDKIVAALIKAGKFDEPDGFGLYPIHIAALHDNVVAVRALVRAGVNFEQRDPNHKTPLMSAASANAPATAKLLLQLGADPLATNDDPKIPRTAFSYAQLGTPNSPVYSTATEELLHAATFEAARKKTKKQLDVFVVQDDKRIHVDGSPIVLKRKPFSFEFTLTNTDSVLVHATLDDAFIRALSTDPIHSSLGSGGTFEAEPNDHSTHDLFLQPDDRGNQVWWANKDGTRFDSSRRKDGKLIATRQIATFTDLGPTPHTMTPVAQSTLPSLYLAFGIGESIGFPEEAIVQATTTELRFSE